MVDYDIVQVTNKDEPAVASAASAAVVGASFVASAASAATAACAPVQGSMQHASLKHINRSPT